MYYREQLFIDGKWDGAQGDSVITVISPHSEAEIGHAACAGPGDVDRAVQAARAAFDTGPWPRMQPSERIEAIGRLAAVYKERRADMAALISAEIGAPISFAKRAQVALPLMMLSAFCGIAGSYQWQQDRPGLYGKDIRIRKQPVGVVAAVVPWNMPQFLTVAKVIPALLAGCSVVLKPAPESVLDALLLADLVDEADLPPGVLNVVPGGRDVGELLVSHAGVDKVSFTGSTAAGRQVALACAAGLKQVSLELGGKSAAIVLDDADPSAVATGIQMASLANSGQVCNALSRILVPAAREAEFVDALAAAMESMPVGDPADPNTQIGPLVAQRQQERVRGYIESGRSEGARLVVGGADMPDGLDTGWYVRPTLFSDANNDMRIAREEIFGPVLCVQRFKTDEEAIALANGTDYGLAATAWTRDMGRAKRLARAIKAGYVVIRTSGQEGADSGCVLSHEAQRASGFGSELGLRGLQSYSTLKLVHFSGA